MEKQWHRLVSDGDGHEYVIPLEKTTEWNDFMEIPSDDERSWDVPEWAKRIEGRLQFSEWREL